MGKDKQKGSRPKSAYIFFTQDKRQYVIDKNPGINPKEIMKELGKLWKETSDSEKEKYKKMAEEDKARCAEEKEKNPGASEKKSKPKKSKKAQKSESDDSEEGKDGDENDDDDDDE